MEHNDSDKRLDEILRKSVDLFRMYGIRSVSMDDIAREMSISKKTLYLFVSNKADLIRQSLQKTTEVLDEWMQDLRQQDLNAIDELLEISKKMNEENSKFSPANAFELKKYYPQLLREHLNQEKQQVYAYCKKNLENGISQGLYRDDLDVDLISGLYIQKIAAIHDGDFFEQEKYSFEKLFEVMFENHIRGIANEEGLAYFEERKAQINYNH